MIYPECDKCKGHDFKVSRVPRYQREYMPASRFVKEATKPHVEIGGLIDHYCNMTCTACGAVYRFVLRSGPPPRYSQLPVEFMEPEPLHLTTLTLPCAEATGTGTGTTREFVEGISTDATNDRPAS